MSRPPGWIAKFITGLALALGLAVSVGWMAYGYYFAGDAQLGPEQPIPFSHRLHVTDKDIDCRFCHGGVDRAHQAGLPPIQTCMFCHQSVITEHPEIRELWRYHNEEEPIPWNRVFEVPDHVYFTHRVHTQEAGLDCTDCHGPVEQLERLSAPRVFEMGFCLECHRPRGASTDCWTCHQ